MNHDHVNQTRIYIDLLLEIAVESKILDIISYHV